jgi:hypothetical protein
MRSRIISPRGVAFKRPQLDLDLAVFGVLIASTCFGTIEPPASQYQLPASVVNRGREMRFCSWSGNYLGLTKVERSQAEFVGPPILAEREIWNSAAQFPGESALSEELEVNVNCRAHVDWLFVLHAGLEAPLQDRSRGVFVKVVTAAVHKRKVSRASLSINNNTEPDRTGVSRYSGNLRISRINLRNHRRRAHAVGFGNPFSNVCRRKSKDAYARLRIRRPNQSLCARDQLTTNFDCATPEWRAGACSSIFVAENICLKFKRKRKVRGRLSLTLRLADLESAADERRRLLLPGFIVSLRASKQDGQKIKRLSILGFISSRSLPDRIRLPEKRDHLQKNGAIVDCFPIRREQELCPLKQFSGISNWRWGDLPERNKLDEQGNTC